MHDALFINQGQRLATSARARFAHASESDPRERNGCQGQDCRGSWSPRSQGPGLAASRSHEAF
jgi:hypothetical protein